MNAIQSPINVLDQPGFKHRWQLWGDLICGVKAQLQSIGIAVGMAFPGEVEALNAR